MIIVGLTGGIGSGKTTVAKMFNVLGAPVYIADEEAKRLTNTSKIIHKKLIKLLGKRSYREGILDRKYVADKIFDDQALLRQVNDIIHPKVAQHFNRWVKKQQGAYCIKEAAILFESGSYKNCDITILVVAPKKERIKRVIKRDHITKESIEARINNQWTDYRKRKLADFIIENLDLKTTQEKVKKIHLHLLNS